MINEYAYETTTPWDAPVVRPLTNRRLRLVPDGLSADGGSAGRTRVCARWLGLGLELAESPHGAAFPTWCHARSADGPRLGPRRLGDRGPWGGRDVTVVETCPSRAPSPRLVVLGTPKDLLNGESAWQVAHQENAVLGCSFGQSRVGASRPVHSLRVSYPASRLVSCKAMTIPDGAHKQGTARRRCSPSRGMWGVDIKHRTVPLATG